MRKVFADAQYWVALIHNQDQSHAAARAVSRTLQGVPLVTTEEALTEVLAFFCEGGPHLRQLAAATVRSIYVNPTVEVAFQSHQSFLAGLTLYEGRLDKGYSLTDCISMHVMREQGIAEVLTQDEHFAQEGFTKLL